MGSKDWGLVVNTQAQTRTTEMRLTLLVVLSHLENSCSQHCATHWLAGACMVARESSQSIIARIYVTCTIYMYNEEHVLNPKDVLGKPARAGAHANQSIRLPNF